MTSPNIAKSLNPSRHPPRVFLVCSDGEVERGLPPVEGTLSYCNWSDMNADLDAVRPSDEWPAPVLRAGRVRLEIHEPVRPYGINLVMHTSAKAGSRPPIAPRQAFAPSQVPSAMTIVDFLDAPNPNERVPRRIHEHLLPRQVRLYRESLVEVPGMTHVDLLPADEAAEEFVLVNASWQERAIPLSQVQHGIADTAPDPRSIAPDDKVDAHVSASWLFHFVNA